MKYERLDEYPNRLEDVTDPCGEVYWSSRGMRPVRCTRPAKATVTDPHGRDYRVCGVHAASSRRAGWRVEA